MNKGIITLACAALLLSSCASEFNSVYKYADSDYKYEYAKEAFACGKFQQATSLLEELVTIEKGSDIGIWLLSDKAVELLAKKSKKEDNVQSSMLRSALPLGSAKNV